MINQNSLFHIFVTTNKASNNKNIKAKKSVSGYMLIKNKIGR